MRYASMSATRTNKVEASDIAAHDPKAIAAIGRALEAHYASLVQAPLPGKFVELLTRLEQDEASPPQRRPDALG